MNAHAQSSAIAGPTVTRGPSAARKPRPSRSKYAHILDMSDDKEVEVARKVRYFELGGDYTCFEFRRAVANGQRLLWALVDTVPKWRIDGCRYSVHWWNIDTERQGWHERPTLGRAMALLNRLTLN